MAHMQVSVSRVLVVLLAGSMFASAGYADTTLEAEKTRDSTALVLQDPYERWNRKVFSFNRGLDRYTLKPVAKTYNKIMPRPIHKGISSFLDNLTQPWSSVNHLLQGHPITALKNLAKFSLNTMTTLGFYDLAKQQGLEVSGEDFGQTLAVWGVSSGPYLMLPFLGPSSYREGAGLAMNQVGSLYTLVGDPEIRYAGWGLATVDTRANLLALENVIQGDEYVLLRDFWWQSRLNAIYNGAAVTAPVPVDDSFGDDDWDDTAADDANHTDKTVSDMLDIPAVITPTPNNDEPSEINPLDTQLSPQIETTDDHGASQ